MRMKLVALLLLTLTLSFCSFGYQILITFCIFSILGGSVLPWLVAMGAFLLGLGFGSLRAHELDQEKLAERLIPYEILIALIGGFSLWILLLADSALNISPLQDGIGNTPLSHQIILGTLATVLCGGVGYLSGFELPIILKAFDKKIMQAYSHWIIGFHYTGTLFSSIFIQTLLLPKADMMRASLVLGLISCGLALISTIFVSTRNRNRYLVATVLIILCLSTAMSWSDWVYQYYLRIHYVRPTISSLNWYHVVNAREILNRAADVERTRTRYQYIDLVRFPSRDDDKKMDTVLYLDTHLQFGSNKERIYHELITHVPISVFGPIPKRALITGGGDGLIARELLRYKEVEQIDLVELDPELLDMAMLDSRLTALNENSLFDKRVNVVVDDAFQYLRQKNIPQYDAIFIDFPFPHNPDLARLYSREFYQLAKRHLAPNGFIVLDFPMELNRTVDGGRNDLIFNTLKAAGFNQFFPFFGYDAFIAARVSSSSINPVRSELISQTSGEVLKLRSDVLESVHWNRSYVHSIFHPLSFGQGFE